MKKKLTALLLCLVMALSLIPAVAHADIASGAGWRLDSAGRLHITGAVNYTENNVPWGSYKKQIKTVVAETGASITNGYGLFSEYTALTSVDLSKLNTNGMTSIRAMFSGCSSLTTLDLSNFDTSSVTSMLGVFSGCKKLTTLDISSFRISGNPTVSAFFNGCSELAELKVSPSVLNKTADQLIGIGSKWKNSETDTVYTTAADLQAVTVPVTLAKISYVTFVTTNGVTVSYKSRNYANGERAEIPAGESVALYAQKIPNGMKLDDMTASDGTPMGNGGTICRRFTMPGHNLTVTVTLEADNDLKGTLSVSGTRISGNTLTASLSGANSTNLTYQWLQGSTVKGTGATYAVPDDFVGTLTCVVTASDKVGSFRTDVSIASPVKHTLTFVIPYGTTVEYDGGEYANGDSVEVNVGKQVLLYAHMPDGVTLQSMILDDGTYAESGGTICRKFAMPDRNVTVTVQLSGTPASLPGDINNDGSVNNTDLTILLRHVAKIAVITDEDTLRKADYNHDNKVDALDVTRLASELTLLH